jgi:diadenosine tetraphosphate (Ap4A) HIT family hydrolase
MGYQFIHIEGYARTGGKTKEGGKKKSIRQITNEVERVPGNTPHIEKPEPPKLIYGCAPGELEQLAENWASESKDAQGRKIRKDGLILLAGVASLSREEEQNFDDFAQATVNFLAEKYGDRLKSVVVHNDEAHPHLHFYVLPKVGEKFEDIHPGFKASKTAKTGNKLKGEQNQEYKQAMRVFQDEFSQKVAMSFGLTRRGPGRRRLTRKAWVAEQKQAEFFANSKAVAQKGYRDGFKKGIKKATVKAEKLGAKVGAVFEVLKNGWHKPTQQANAEIEALKAEVKAAEDKAKKQADRGIQEEKKRRVVTEKELEKYKNIAINTEAENKRLSAEIEVLNGYKKDSNRRQDLTKPK